MSFPYLRRHQCRIRTLQSAMLTVTGNNNTIIVILSQLYSYASSFFHLLFVLQILLFLLFWGLMDYVYPPVLSLLVAFMVTGECPGTNHK